MSQCEKYAEPEEQPERSITTREMAERVGALARHDPALPPRGPDPRPGLPGHIRPVRFVWSEVEAVWDCDAQLTIGDAA